MNGAFLPKSPLNNSLTKLKAGWLETVLLILGGALAVVLHQALRLPLNLPGRHGIEWMALLVIGRALGRSRLAGTTFSLGASAFSILPIWGVQDDPFIWLVYLLPGLMMDGAFHFLPGWHNKIWFLASLAGVAHITKPLLRWMVNVVTGFPYGSLLIGLAYPLATHLLFGVVGGLLGAAVVLGVRRFR